MKRKTLLTRATMSEAQRNCFDLLCDLFHGEHHAPEQIYPFGQGIKCSVPDHQMATFDFNYLTRLVVLAHDRCIRVAVVASAPGRIGLVLFQRHGRTGMMYERHPTMEDAVNQIRLGA